MFRVGEKISAYTVAAKLRGGGMGSLFIARREGVAGFSKPVAIKVLHEHLCADPSFIEMFLDEARLCARIQHPNVVHFEEFGKVGDAYFLVMEYVKGCTLSGLARNLARSGRKLSPAVLAHVVSKVADGLHSAHELKSDDGEQLDVVHRDISPQNILLSYSGHVKLIDFGIAKSRQRLHRTESRSLKGKIRYMSPEQAFGRDVDRRTDIYALGVILWELLTMRRLFRGDDDFAVLDAVRDPLIPPPSELADDVSPQLDEVVLRALSKDREDRFGTALEFRRALSRAVPDSMRVDSSQLAELLGVVMSREIESLEQKLPSDIGRALTHERPEPTRSAEVTMSALTASTKHSDLLEELEQEVDAELDFIAAATPSRRRTRRIFAAAAVTILATVGGWFALARSTPASAPASDVTPVVDTLEPIQEASPPAIVTSVATGSSQPTMTEATPVQTSTSPRMRPARRAERLRSERRASMERLSSTQTAETTQPSMQESSMQESSMQESSMQESSMQESSMQGSSMTELSEPPTGPRCRDIDGVLVCD